MRVADQESWRLFAPPSSASSTSLAAATRSPPTWTRAHRGRRSVRPGCTAPLRGDIDELSQARHAMAAVTGASTEAPGSLRAYEAADDRLRRTIERAAHNRYLAAVTARLRRRMRRRRLDDRASPFLPDGRIDSRCARRRDSTRRPGAGIARGPGRDRPARKLGLAYARRPEAPPMRAAVYRRGARRRGGVGCRSTSPAPTRGRAPGEPRLDLRHGCGGVVGRPAPRPAVRTTCGNRTFRACRARP